MRAKIVGFVAAAAAFQLAGCRQSERSQANPPDAFKRRPACQAGERVLPSVFEAVDGGSGFLARGLEYEAVVDAPGIAVGSGDTLARVSFVGRDRGARLETGPVAGKFHYVLGPNPSAWRFDVPVHDSVNLRNMYRGVDAVFYGCGRELEFDLVLAPGVDPAVIALRIEGLGQPQLDTEGNISAASSKATLRLRKPVLYQGHGPDRRRIEGRFILRGDRTIGIQASGLDPRLALVVDPIVSYTTYLSGPSLEEARAVALDTGGAAHVVGYTNSLRFPVGHGFARPPLIFPSAHLQPPGNLSPSVDAFLVKMTPAGSNFSFALFYGSNFTDIADAVALAPDGSIWIAGNTNGGIPNVNGVPATQLGKTDAFVAKIASDGSALQVGSAFGGTQDDGASAIAVDAAGDAYVVGTTSSPNFPVVGTQFPGPHGGTDGFVAKMSAQGGPFLVSGYLGGPGTDRGHDVAVHRDGVITLAGAAGAPHFALASVPHPIAGSEDGFLLTVTPGAADSGRLLLLGGSAGDRARAVTIAPDGDVVVAGNTESADFPTTAAAHSRSLTGPSDMFVTRLEGTSSTFAYSTYYHYETSSGPVAQNEHALDLAAGDDDSVWATGYATFFARDQPLGLAVRFSKTGERLSSELVGGGIGQIVRTVFIGFHEIDEFAEAHIFGVGVDRFGGAFYVGDSNGGLDVPERTSNGEFSLSDTLDGDERAFGKRDGFVIRRPTPRRLTALPARPDFGKRMLGSPAPRPSITVRLSNDSTTDAVQLRTITLAGAPGYSLVSSTCGAELATAQTCELTLDFEPQALGRQNGRLEVLTNGDDSPMVISLVGEGLPPGPALTINPTSLGFGTSNFGTTFPPQAIQLTSSGTSTVEVSSVQIETTGSGAFSVENGCSTAMSFGQGCTISVSYEPPAPGAHSATLVIASNVPGNPLRVPLTGAAHGASIVRDPAELDFGDHPPLVASAPRTVTLTNNGVVPLTITGWTLSGTDAASFQLTGDTCRAAPVPPGNNCTLEVVFEARHAFRHLAWVDIASNAYPAPPALTLWGTGVGAALTYTPALWDFGSVMVGALGPTATLRVRNSGTASIEISNIRFEGPGAPAFVLATGSDNCLGRVGTSALRTGQQCSIHASFRPVAGGRHDAVVVLETNAARREQSHPVLGFGDAPTALLVWAPDSITFEDQPVGGRSHPRTLRVRNQGLMPLTLETHEISSLDFTIVSGSDGCSSQTLPAGQTCEMSVVFAPLDDGRRQATITFRSNDPRGAVTASLAGLGYVGLQPEQPLSACWRVPSDAAAVSPAGDVNGDGFADVLVGRTGQALVFLGSAQGLEVAPAWTATADASDQSFAEAVAAAGDINGDGYDDIAIASPAVSFGSAKVQIFFGGRPSAGDPSGLGPPTADLVLDGTGSFGRQMVALDANNDGFGDLAIARPDAINNNTAKPGGRVYAYEGGPNGLTAAGDWSAGGFSGTEYFGQFLATGRFDDGPYDDLVIGALNRGPPTVLLGGPAGLPTNADGPSDPWNLSGLLLADMNRDGRDDIVYTRLGAPVSITYGGGATPPGPASTLLAFVAKAGDFNGDGAADLIVSSPQGPTIRLNDGVGIPSAPGFRLAPGLPSSPDTAAIGDTNGDGFDDVVVVKPRQGSSAGELVAFCGVGLRATVTSVDFGEVTLSTTSSTETVTVDNLGVSGQVSAIAVAGTDPEDFVLEPDSSTCRIGDNLLKGLSCTTGLRFRPTVVGRRRAQLRVSLRTNSGTQSVTVDLVGIGNPPSPTALPPPANAGTFVVATGNTLNRCLFRGPTPLWITIPVRRALTRDNSTAQNWLDGGYLRTTGGDGRPVLQRMIDNQVIGATARLQVAVYGGRDSGSSTAFVGRHDLTFGTNNSRDVQSQLQAVEGQWTVREVTLPISAVQFSRGQAQDYPGLNAVRIDIGGAAAATGECLAVGWASLSFKMMAPVVLVHGNGSNGDFWRRRGFSDRLDELRVPSDNSISMSSARIRKNAERLQGFIPTIAAELGADQIHIVAHSKGGLDTRAWLAAAHPRNFSVLSLTTLSTPHKGAVGADLLIAQQKADVIAQMDLDLSSRFALAFGSGDDGTPDLTTKSTAEFNRTNLGLLPRGTRYLAIAADADLNNTGEIERFNPDEYFDARQESASLRARDRNWTDLSKAIINSTYDLYRDYASVEIFRVHTWPVGTIVVGAAVCCGDNNDFLVSVSSAKGSPPFTTLATLNSRSPPAAASRGVDGADHASVANENVAGRVFTEIQRTERMLGAFSRP